MVAQAIQQRRIESFYGREELETATPGRRLGGYALDTLIVIVTLLIGWIIWFAIVAQRGQTPGKQLLGMYIMREDGSRAGGWYTVLREVVVEGLLFGTLIATLTSGLGWALSALWCTWDRERQCLWDKVASTYVAYSPNGFQPLTAQEMRFHGQGPPALASPSGVGRADAPEPAPTSGGGGTADRLRELRDLHDEGLISDEQFEERRSRIAEEL